MEKYKFKIIKTNDTPYKYNVQIWYKYDNNYFYNGFGKFCKTLKEIKEYKKEYKQIY